MAPAITLDQHNKTLQLSPRRSSEAVHAVLNSMQCWVDAAAQLSSMLGVHRFWIVLHPLNWGVQTRECRTIKSIGFACSVLPHEQRGSLPG
jgi:hypothetical protein